MQGRHGLVCQQKFPFGIPDRNQVRIGIDDLMNETLLLAEQLLGLLAVGNIPIHPDYADDLSLAVPERCLGRINEFLLATLNITFLKALCLPVIYDAAIVFPVLIGQYMRKKIVIRLSGN